MCFSAIAVGAQYIYDYDLTVWKKATADGAVNLSTGMYQKFHPSTSVTPDRSAHRVVAPVPFTWGTSKAARFVRFLYNLI